MQSVTVSAGQSTYSEMHSGAGLRTSVQLLTRRRKREARVEKFKTSNGWKWELPSGNELFRVRKPTMMLTKAAYNQLLYSEFRLLN